MNFQLFINLGTLKSFDTIDFLLFAAHLNYFLEFKLITFKFKVLMSLGLLFLFRCLKAKSSRIFESFHLNVLQKLKK